MANYTAELRDRVLNDPEFQRLWSERINVLVKSGYTGGTSFVVKPEYAAEYTSAMQPLVARFKALGGDENNFPRIGADGAPEGTPVKSKAAFIGKTALYAGAALAGGYLSGALQPAAGAASAGASTAAAAAPVAASVAPAAGLSGAGGTLAALGGLKGVLSAVGPVAGAIAGARGRGRQAEGDYGLSRDRAEAERALTNSRIDDTRMQQALRLALLGGVEDAQITPPPNIAARMPTLTGGAKPSAIKNKSQIIDAMMPRILQSLTTGEHVPALSEEPKSNWLDRLLEGASYAGAFTGALPKRTQLPTPGVDIGVRNPDIVRNSGTSFR